METALGASMQHIVVETEQDAKNAIRLLKQRDWGRATFLPLTTIRGSVYSPREIEGMPGFVGMANTLCSCEEKYGSIRDSLLGRVAVAEDLDSAAAIAKRTATACGWSVWTARWSRRRLLDWRSKGRSSGLLSRASEIQRIREKAADLQRQAEAAQQEYRQRQGELSSCEAELDAARGELSSAQEERIRITSERARVSRELEQLAETAAGLEKEQSDSEGRLQELGEREKAVRAAISQLEGQVRQAETESQRLSAFGRSRCPTATRSPRPSRKSAWESSLPRKIGTPWPPLWRVWKSARGILRGCFTAAAGNGRCGKKTRHLEQQRQAALVRAQEQRGQAEAKRQSLQSIAQQRSGLEREAQSLREREREVTAQRENVGRDGWPACKSALKTCRRSTTHPFPNVGGV